MSKTADASLARACRKALELSSESLAMPRGFNAWRSYQVLTHHTRTGIITGYYRDLQALASELGVVVRSRGDG